MSDTTPAIRAELVDVPGGQFALFDDPRQLLALSDDALDSLTDQVFDAADGFLPQLRRAVGLLAWAKRHKCANTNDYGKWVEKTADRLGIAYRTVGAWRETIETELGLAVFTRKADPKPVGQSRRSKPRDAESASTPAEISASPQADGGPADEGASVTPSSPAQSPGGALLVPPPVERPTGPEVGPAGNGDRGEPGTALSDGAHETPSGPTPSPRTRPGSTEGGAGSPSAVNGATPLPSKPPNADAVQVEYDRDAFHPPMVPSESFVKRVVRWLTSMAGIFNKLDDRDLDALERLIAEERKRRAPSNGSQVPTFFKAGKR